MSEFDYEQERRLLSEMGRGVPASYCHVVWKTASGDDPCDYYDELDKARWSIRCVRRFRDGRLLAYSFASPNWRDVMPESAFPSIEEINADDEFLAAEISAGEFEAIWDRATASE
ncbi:hypothetical protein [Nitratireductor sp. XY-223]|uniref:DUF6881 domain-containing protein n=1 Tax=Nitratireductor sp. XY-223 TaxID=2561926 RepID=UPI0010AA7E2A|nr:hypothetical protein [Nitratireductor sp. XY-223]